MVALIFAYSTLASPFPVQKATDSLGHEFNFGGDNNETVTYGSGTARYGRVPGNVEIANHSMMEICLSSGVRNLSYNAWLGASQSYHPANRGFENATTKNCFSWQINSSYVEERKLHFSIWGRDSDGNFSHSPRSRSDFYLQLRYENVTVVEPEEENEKTGTEEDSGFLSGVFNWITGLF